MARHRDGSEGGRAAPDVMPRAVPNALAAVRDEMSLQVPERRQLGPPVGQPVIEQYPFTVELHAVFEPDENGWVRATIEELPEVITCAPTIDEARELVRDALSEWLLALTTPERAAVGADATRETLTLEVA